MSQVIVKTAHYWVQLPPTDERTTEWLNLAAATSVAARYDPVVVTVAYSEDSFLWFEGLRAIAIIDALEELAGKGKNDD